MRWLEGRQRQAGGGRKAAQEKAPQLLKALGSLVEPVTRGDPQSPLKWTGQSTRELAKEGKKLGHVVSPTTVAKLLKEAGYSLPANRKTITGAQHPDRNVQFEHINRRVKAQQRGGSLPSQLTPRRKRALATTKIPVRRGNGRASPSRSRRTIFRTKRTGKPCRTAAMTSGRTKRGGLWASVLTPHNSPWPQPVPGGSGGAGGVISVRRGNGSW